MLHKIGTDCGDTKEVALSPTFIHKQETLCSTGLIRHGHDSCESVEPLECVSGYPAWFYVLNMLQSVNQLGPGAWADF